MLSPLVFSIRQALQRKLGMTGDMRQKFKQVRAVPPVAPNAPLLTPWTLPPRAHSFSTVRSHSSLPPVLLPLQAGLSKEKERELNDAIQAHFREWLQVRGGVGVQQGQAVEDGCSGVGGTLPRVAACEGGGGKRRKGS